MTDKVQKIREEVVRLRKSYQIMYQELDCESPELMSVCAKRNLCQDILMFIDSLQEEPVSEDFEEALAKEWKGYNERGAALVDALEDNTQELAFAKGFYKGSLWQKKQDQSTIELAEDHAYFAGRTKTIDEIKEALLSEVLPCFMHGGEADEVVAKLDEVLNQKK